LPEIGLVLEEKQLAQQTEQLLLDLAQIQAFTYLSFL